MVGRRRKNLTQGPTVIVTVCCLFILYLLLKNPSAIILLILVVGGVTVAVAIVLPARRRRSLVEKANVVIDQHSEQLAKRRAQLVRQDAYGKQVVDKWMSEIDYFITNHIGPVLTIHERSLLHRERPRIAQLIMQRVANVTRDMSVFEEFSNQMTPMEFEAFCAGQLRQSGWDAYMTRQSRDQGVDVIAEKNGERIVLQCKLYSRPVGNKAVQEAVAAKAYEQAHYCAVVSNSSYTSAAEELASTNKVLLLHYSDLRRIELFLQRMKIYE